MPSQQEMIPTNSFYLVQVVFFFCLPATFNSQAIDGWCEQNTFSHCMYRRRQVVSTSHMIVPRSRVAQVELCALKHFSRSVSCFAPRLTPCTVHPAICPLFHFRPYSSIFHWLRLKVERVHNVLRRFTRLGRWRFCGSRTSHSACPSV